jgi:hypothetical protein
MIKTFRVTNQFQKEMCLSTVLLGIASLIFAFFNMLLTVILAIEGILLAVIGRGEYKKLFISGLVLNFVGLSIAVFFLLK